MGLEIAGIVLALAGLFAGYKGTQAANQAQEDARKLETRKAALDNARKARRAVAEQRMMRAELIQNTASMDARTSSAMSGATGSLATQTASNIGHANTMLAGDVGINRALTRGARQSAKWDTYAGIANVASQAASFKAGQNAMQTQQNAFQEQLVRQQRSWSYQVQASQVGPYDPNNSRFQGPWKQF